MMGRCVRASGRTWAIAGVIALVAWLAFVPTSEGAPLRGQLDPSFGHAGRVLFGHGSSFAKTSYESVALQPDGSAVFAGHTETIEGKYVERATLIQRRLPDGQIDPGFYRVAEPGGGYGSI